MTHALMNQKRIHACERIETRNTVYCGQYAQKEVYA